MVMLVGRSRARGVLLQILRCFRRFRVSPSPENYRLLHAHFTGQTPALSAALEPLLADQRLDDAQLLRLYEVFFGEARRMQEMEEAGAHLDRLSHELDREIVETGASARRFREEMAKVAERAQLSRSVEELRGLVGDMMAQVNGLIAHMGRLEQRLADTRARMADLRAKLARSREEALTDPLTGLANRRRLDRALEEAVERARAGGGVPVLLLIDVDHFKQFNDRHGHLVGDQVLKVVGQLLRSHVKDRDLVARAGGEEFAVLLRDVAPEEAVRVAERLRELVGSRRIRLRNSGETLGRVTISVGVTPYAPPEPVADWVERADEALYAAKRQGRNQVVARMAPRKASADVQSQGQRSRAGADALASSAG